MAEKLSAEDRNRLKLALASWQSWQSGPEQLPEVITQLGGDSNLSFVVSDGLQQWVLRLNNPTRDIGVNRDNERAAMRSASAAGISPSTNFHSDAVLVTPFLPGQQATLKSLSQIGDLFRRIHSLPVELLPIDLLRNLKNYYEQAEEEEPLLTECYHRVVDLYPEQAVDLKPCHNDCLLPNMLEGERGLYVIDWEYAAAADPAFDLAVFTCTYDLDQAQLKLLLSAYTPGQDFETADLISRIRYYEKLYQLIEILWWDARNRSVGEKLKLLARKLEE